MSNRSYLYIGACGKAWHGEQFCLHQDTNWGIAIFSTRQNITALVQSQQLYTNATFQTVPQTYEQMFTILGTTTTEKYLS